MLLMILSYQKETCWILEQMLLGVWGRTDCPVFTVIRIDLTLTSQNWFQISQGLAAEMTSHRQLPLHRPLVHLQKDCSINFESTELTTQTKIDFLNWNYNQKMGFCQRCFLLLVNYFEKIRMHHWLCRWQDSF